MSVKLVIKKANFFHLKFVNDKTFNESYKKIGEMALKPVERKKN
jgi:hypothetical protein